MLTILLLNGCVILFAIGMSFIINKKQIKIGVMMMLLGFAIGAFLIYDFITNFHLPLC